MTSRYGHGRNSADHNRVPRSLSYHHGILSINSTLNTLFLLMGIWQFDTTNEMRAQVSIYLWFSFFKQNTPQCCGRNVRRLVYFNFISVSMMDLAIRYTAICVLIPQGIEKIQNNSERPSALDLQNISQLESLTTQRWNVNGGMGICEKY